MSQLRTQDDMVDQYPMYYKLENQYLTDLQHSAYSSTVNVSLHKASFKFFYNWYDLLIRCLEISTTLPMSLGSEESVYNIMETQIS